MSQRDMIVLLQLAFECRPQWLRVDIIGVIKYSGGIMIFTEVARNDRSFIVCENIRYSDTYVGLHVETLRHSTIIILWVTMYGIAHYK